MALSFLPVPFELEAGIARFAVDIEYGDDDENVFDIFLPESSQQTPVVIYYHAGGFTGGNKEELYLISTTLVRSLLENGIAVASVNYPLLNANETEGVIKPLQANRRALQFIRYHADNLNIDPDRVALMGTSAGAGSALWIGFGQEAGEVNNADPVLRQSTRVQALVGLETQASYDIGRWETDVFPSVGITLAALSQPDVLLDRILQFYAIDDADELFTEEGESYRAEVDMLGLMSSDDPEFYVRNVAFPLPPTLDDEGTLFHHPLHARALVQQAQAVGLEYVADLPTVPAIGSADEGLTAFLLRKLNQ